MPGDYSRNTFDPVKHYIQVRMQQGRVQLDADWNEQVALQDHAQRTALDDLIGTCGVVKDSNAFRIQALPNSNNVQDLAINPGRCYVNGRIAIAEASTVTAVRVGGQADQIQPEAMAVDGQAYAAGQWLRISDRNSETLSRIIDVSTGTLTLDAELSALGNELVIRRVPTYATQPHQPAVDFVSGGTLSLPDGRYEVYLNAWQREVTSWDDPQLLEKALGGADTTTRLQCVWQVGIAEAGANTTCDSPLPDSVTARSSGRMNARTQPQQDQADACQLPPTAGYRRLENQLYRVEVQQSGDRNTATFKWSRDNATVTTRVDSIDGRVLTVADLGRDELLGFAPGQWVEIGSEQSVLSGTPHPLFEIESVDPGRRQITLRTTAATLADGDNLQLRRWDQSGDHTSASGVAMDVDWVELESGIEVLFSDGTYSAGDFWLIPARTATGEIEWPPYAVPNTAPIPQPPQGIHHDYCRLAQLDVENGAATLLDCRREFPHLTQICAEDVCFDNSACQLDHSQTVQEALDALCARPTGGSPLVSGVVVFRIGSADQDEFVSGFLDPGLGRGQLQVILGLEQGRNEPVFIGPMDVFETFTYPSVLLGAEVRPSDGDFRIAIRIQNREQVGSNVRVRWWAMPIASDQGEVVVGGRPTIGPTLVPPTAIPTVSPTIGPTLAPPTLGPTISPTIAPTFAPPTLSPTVRPTARPTRIVPPIRPGAGEVLPLTDVRGVGEVFSERLGNAGITDVSALASADVETVATVLGVSEVRARAIVEAARDLERG